MYPNGPKAEIISRTLVLDPSERRTWTFEFIFLVSVIFFSMWTCVTMKMKTAGRNFQTHSSELQLGESIMENIPDTIGIDSPTLDQTVQHQAVREGHDRIGSIGQIQIRFDFAGTLPFLQKAVEQLVELPARISFDSLQPGDMLAFQEAFDPKPDENAVI